MKMRVIVVLICFAAAVSLPLLKTSAPAAIAIVHAEAPFPVPPTKSPEVREREVRRVQSVFGALQSVPPGQERPGQRITESELNSYLSYLVEQENIAGLETLFVRLRPGFFDAFAIINVDNMPQEDRNIGTQLLMQTLLAGKQYISTEGSLSAANGRGQYTLTSARIGQVDIAPGIVNTLIALIGRKLNPPFDLTRPFRLPYGVQKAEVGQGYMEIW